MATHEEFSSEQAAMRLVEEAFYAKAIREIESGDRRDGIWAMAMAESEMNQARASALYIKLRVQSLKDEMTLTAHSEALAEQKRKEAAAEASIIRHPGCGGTIHREDFGNVVTWRCAKCKKNGRFQRGVAYGEMVKVKK